MIMKHNSSNKIKALGLIIAVCIITIFYVIIGIKMPDNILFYSILPLPTVVVNRIMNIFFMCKMPKVILYLSELSVALYFIFLFSLGESHFVIYKVLYSPALIVMFVQTYRCKDMK